MCGRYAFSDIDEIYEARRILEEVAQRLGDEQAAAVKTGEVFPTERAAVVAQRPDGAHAEAMRWGYPMNGRLLINARSETIAEKPLFARSIAGGKCLVPCTGFFEWKTEGKRKQKFLIRPEGTRFFYLAGLYSRFVEDGRTGERFVIITAPANEAMKEVHPRMPLIVPKESPGLWLENRLNENSINEIYRLTEKLDLQAV
jgi:putative SOS response-associated peptidase YedK